jgi:hypothetical protein
MRPVPLRALLAGLLGLAIVSLTSADEAKDAGFKPLFNGTDLTGWKFILADDKADPAKTFSVKDKVLHVTGKPFGYVYTDKTYSNYVLRFDWRYKRPEGLEDDLNWPGNSGCLMHIQEPGKRFNPKAVWPQCVESQGRQMDHGKIFFMGVKNLGATYDKKAKDKVVRKVGEWNTTEVTCKPDGSLSVKINGTPVSTGKSPLTSGHIGFQSEGAEIHFRNIEIKEMGSKKE